MCGIAAGVVLLLLLLLGRADPLSAEDGALRLAELNYLRAAVAEELFPYAHLEVPALPHLAITGEGAERCLGLRTFHGQQLKNHGVRAELSVDYPFREGDTVEYAWRFRIPADFTADPANRWWVFADWHDQPDRNRGETWEGFPSRSAPLILGYGRLNGQDMLGLTYGSPDLREIGAIPFSRGAWHAVTMRITWSRGANGAATLSVDGGKPLSATGCNMHNGFQHYLKVGSYRHPDIAGDSWVYLQGVGIHTVAAPSAAR